MTTRRLRIGLDVAQTCQERAGCGWQADSLARALVAAAGQHEYFLYHHFDRWINASTAAGTRLDAPGVHSPLAGFSAEEATACWQQVRAGKTALPGDPDIVQSNSFQAPLMGRARLVFFVHDVSYWVHPGFATEGTRLHCQDGVLAALSRADGFLFNSEFTRREFDRVLAGWLERSGRPWTVTPLGGRDGAAMLPPVEGRFWLAVGSLEPRKNYETLLDALDLYWPRSPRPLPLRIAGGEGWKSEALRRRLESMAGQGRVEWLGYVPDAELARLYAGATALVFPSWYEGFGLPVLEAMDRGAPVICSDAASLPEVGGDAAIYVDPASAESIAHAMLALEADPARRTRLGAAGQRQAERFTWERTARETLQFYRRVLDAPPAFPP